MTLHRNLSYVPADRRHAARPIMRVIEGGRSQRRAPAARWALGADGRLACRWRLEDPQ
jgi:hypothetical protein